MEESEYENNFPLFRQVHLLLLLKLQLRQLLTQQQQLMQTHQLIHGMQLMAMDMATVLDIMGMDIDMAMEDMDIEDMDIMERGPPNQPLSQQQMLMLMLMPGILPMAMDMVMV